MWEELHWPAALVSCIHKQIVAIQFGYHTHRAVWYIEPATTRQNTAQHGIYFNKQEGIIREEGEMVLQSRRWWLRTFYTSFEVSYDRSGKCERAGSLSKCKVQRLLHHLFHQHLHMKLCVTTEIIEPWVLSVYLNICICMV